VNESRETAPRWLIRTAAWLTPRRIRAQAGVLAFCLWSVCAIDYATPGVFDRAGNIKFQDFLQFPISAHLIAQGRARELYDDRVLADGIRAIVGRDTNVYLQYFYGPQVALPFLPLCHFSFLTQAELFVTLSLIAYFGSVYMLWLACPNLRPYRALIFLCSIAYPPLFHFFVRGQLSVFVLVCFTAACLPFLARHDWLAGIALGLLAFKPQFLVAIPIVLLVARAWKVLIGLAISASAQVAFAYVYFGPSVMRAYLDMLLHSASRPGTTELTFSPIQMHSLYSFWELLLPWPRVVWGLYIATSLVVIAIAASIWKSSASRAMAFAALIVSAVLVNPHIYIYDLLALVPVFLLLANFIASQATNNSRSELQNRSSLSVSMYLSFVLPLLGFLSRWTHFQLSVPAFCALLWMLWRNRACIAATAGHTLASLNSRVV
jgi:alpha-1,2-mannosyltransferase